MLCGELRSEVTNLSTQVSELTGRMERGREEKEREEKEARSTITSLTSVLDNVKLQLQEQLKAEQDKTQQVRTVH